MAAVFAGGHRFHEKWWFAWNHGLPTTHATIHAIKRMKIRIPEPEGWLLQPGSNVRKPTIFAALLWVVESTYFKYAGGGFNDIPLGVRGAWWRAATVLENLPILWYHSLSRSVCPVSMTGLSARVGCHFLGIDKDSICRQLRWSNTLPG